MSWGWVRLIRTILVTISSDAELLADSVRHSGQSPTIYFENQLTGFFIMKYCSNA